MARPLMVSSGGSNLLHRRGSNPSKRSIHKQAVSSASQLRSDKSQQHSSAKHTLHDKKELVLAIDVHEHHHHHTSISDDNDIIQSPVLYCEVPDAYDNYLSDNYAANDIDSMYPGELEEAVATNFNVGQQLYSHLTSSQELQYDDRYNRTSVERSFRSLNQL